MIPRYRPALLLGLLALAGCAENNGPTSYARNAKLAEELKVKPKFRSRINEVVEKTFGASPRRPIVPPGTALPDGGVHLASLVRSSDRPGAPPTRMTYELRGETVYQEGGYALYRRHCLHCHGVSGEGQGPTAEFLFPRPRDFRPGVFKFTSTVPLKKPTRDDLRRTIRFGLDDTSMPAFDAQMRPDEIEQVIDYVIFLSMRGEVETRLLKESAGAEEADLDGVLMEDVIDEHIKGVFESWKEAETTVVVPPAPRVGPDRASILRGRDLFLKSDCKDCHGVRADGNGKSFIDRRVFDRVVFELTPLDRALEEEFARVEPAVPEGADEAARRRAIEEARKNFEAQFRDAWKNSLDDWGQPIRPADLTRGVYKGGRRPLDIYWRIAKGINGAKMPAHDLPPDQIWDLVNFVLALPEKPTLLRDAGGPSANPGAVANR